MTATSPRKSLWCLPVFSLLLTENPIHSSQLCFTNHTLHESLRLLPTFLSPAHQCELGWVVKGVPNCPNDSNQGLVFSSAESDSQLNKKDPCWLDSLISNTAVYVLVWFGFFISTLKCKILTALIWFLVNYLAFKRQISFLYNYLHGFFFFHILARIQKSWSDFSRLFIKVSRMHRFALNSTSQKLLEFGGVFCFGVIREEFSSVAVGFCHSLHTSADGVRVPWPITDGVDPSVLSSPSGTPPPLPIPSFFLSKLLAMYSQKPTYDSVFWAVRERACVVPHTLRSLQVFAWSWWIL